MMGTCGILEMQLSVSPSSTTSGLIYLETADWSRRNRITFKASTNKDDAKAYQLTVYLRYPGDPNWTSATAKYTYIDPCVDAVVTANSHPDIYTSVLVPASSSVAIWYDSVK